GAEAVGWRGVNRSAKAAVPQSFWRAGCEDFCLECGVGCDLLCLFRARLNKFGLHSECAGSVVGGMDVDGAREIACVSIFCLDVNLQSARACRLFNIDTGKCEPGLAIAT